jgi:hypothetical protein
MIIFGSSKNRGEFTHYQTGRFFSSSSGIRLWITRIRIDIVGIVR